MTSRKLFIPLLIIFLLIAQLCNGFLQSTGRSNSNGRYFSPRHSTLARPRLTKIFGSASHSPGKYCGDDGHLCSYVPPSGSSQVKLENNAVFPFGKGQAQTINLKGVSPKGLLGGKGANLAGMSELGLSVPPGFTLTTEVCSAFHNPVAEKKLPAGVWDEVLKNIIELEKTTHKGFGSKTNPLLVSVRSGAAISMPGMMDTILNLGLNDDTVKGLAAQGGDHFAWDSYRRFLNMFGDVVMGIPHHAFEHEMTELKKKVRVTEDSQLSAADLQVLVNKYKDVYAKHGKRFPTNPLEQLYAAIQAVFDSWQCERAIKYREAEGITGLLGTAVNVQTMCFGNMGPTSGTGVCFTRNPNNGEKKLFGEFLFNAQGEDVVAGIRTPEPIETIKSKLPALYDELMKNVHILESHYHDMQDIEFTIQEGVLYMLQTRSGKRVGPASVKIALDLVKEGLATKDQAILTVKPEHLKQLLHPQFADVNGEGYKKNVAAMGLPASPGAGVGRIVFTPEDAESARSQGESCILVRDDTSPEDVGGMWASRGILTARGGMTSHAAVVARGWGKPCICGCGDLKIDSVAKTLVIRAQKGTGKRDITLREGDWISINGDTGEVLVGKQNLKPPAIYEEPAEGNKDGSTSDVVKFMSWVDERRKLQVYANADTPADAAEARRNGAQGIGLTRTEHMFFSDDRINVVRKMILSHDPAQRKQALDKLLQFQRQDFEGILEAMDGLSVTVRLIDPPLHEFLPKLHGEDGQLIDDEFASLMGMSKEDVIFEVERLQEINPMLGLRGCRLGVMIPEIIEMQTRALVEAALNNKFKKGLNPVFGIMIPLIGHSNEFVHQANLIRETAQQVFRERPGQTIDFKVGTMIEVPRAALTARDIVKAGAEFFSFGTNDLTQMTFGLSRDDAGRFLPTYIKQNLYENDPFQTIDEAGVGKLVQLSSDSAKEYYRSIGKGEFKTGVCGEHGGDPSSVKFFHSIGLDYVSCSPFRIPLARLAAAQAVIEQEPKK